MFAGRAAARADRYPNGDRARHADRDRAAARTDRGPMRRERVYLPG